MPPVDYKFENLGRSAFLYLQMLIIRTVLKRFQN